MIFGQSNFCKMPVVQRVQLPQGMIHDPKTGQSKVDPNDPRVKKLVYSVYRDMLTNYSDDATSFINSQDPSQVTKDYGVGVGPLLENLVRGGAAQTGGGSTGNGGTGPIESSNNSSTGCSMPPPPPPPPMASHGAIPAVRLNTEIGPRDKGPPMALANAMMKDKKPFTYTPGGIDLSEIRSPRMAKRLQMNAAAEGVTSVPQSQHDRPQVTHHATLPPAAMAAMQPQMAISVFPQGGFNPNQLHRTAKPSDFTDGSNGSPNSNSNNSSSAGGSGGKSYAPTSGAPPPPPLAAFMMANLPHASHTSYNNDSPTESSPNSSRNFSSPPPAAYGNKSPVPPPPPERGSVPMSSPQTQPRIESPRPGSSNSTNYPNYPEPDRISPVRIIPVSNNSRQQGNASNSSNAGATHVGTGSIYIPPISSPTASNPKQPPSSSSPIPTSRVDTPSEQKPLGQDHQTKARAASQHLGSIYIPPVEQRPSVFSGPTNPNTPSSAGSSPSVNTPRTPQQQVQSPTSGRSTPQLNKAPTPWMNSYNKMGNKPAESPPYLNTEANMTPWGVVSGPPPGMGGSGPPPGMGGSGPPQQGVVRTIPIAMVRDDQNAFSNFGTMPAGGPHSSGGGSRGPPPPGGMGQKANAAEHLGRVIPIQIQRQESQHRDQQIEAQQMHQMQQMGRTIPIQVEGRQRPTSAGPGSAAGKRVGPPGYNNPMGLYSSQNAAEAYQQQTGELTSGVQNMSLGNEGPRMEPIQSKSMRVIQQVAENELRRLEEIQLQRRMDFMEDDKRLLDLFREQVDEGSPLHNTTEPRFRGGHIPSKAFRTLQTTLPVAASSPQAEVGKKQAQPSYPNQASGGGGPITHNIQIRMSPMSPTPLQQQGEARLPPSEQKITEPKKYMGGNIPSRSFKILQAMTAEDDPNAVDSSSSTATTPTSPIPNDNFLNALSTTFVESPSSTSLESYEDDDTSSTSLPSCPSDTAIADPNYPYDPSSTMDPYSYMSWYYWWYYASCYWAGYDMTGYEYPQGWDPNYPYYPAEFYSENYPGEEYYNLNNANNDNDSTTTNGCQEVCNENGTGGLQGATTSVDRLSQERMISSELPKIVIEAEGSLKALGATTKLNGGLSLSTNNSTTDACDENNDNDARESEEECYWSCGEEQKVIERETADKTLGKNALKNYNTSEYNEDNDSKARPYANKSKPSTFNGDKSYDYDDGYHKFSQTTENKPTGGNEDYYENGNDHGGNYEDDYYGNDLNTNPKVDGSSEPDNLNFNQSLNKSSNQEEEEDDEEDEETEPEDDDEEGGAVGIVEEPDTPTSEDSDAGTLVHEEGCRNVFIEEYLSESEAEGHGRRTRLSTIDEITEASRTSTPGSNGWTRDSIFGDCTRKNSLESPPEEEMEEESEESEEEVSSISVIENRSDATRGTESKREDGTTTSDSSEDDDEEESTGQDGRNKNDGADRHAPNFSNYEYEDDDEEGNIDVETAAVTVRLPLKFSFGKTKSYKDITTVLVGDSEVTDDDDDAYVRNRGEVAATVVNSGNVVPDDEAYTYGEDDYEEDNEPVVSFTISLSRQCSREDPPPDERQDVIDDEDEGESEGEQPDIDFWGEINSSKQGARKKYCEESAPPQAEKAQIGSEDQMEFKPVVDFWGSAAEVEEDIGERVKLRKDKRHDDQCGKGKEETKDDISWAQRDKTWDKEFNFWDKSVKTIETRRFSNFEISEDYESDSGTKSDSNSKQRHQQRVKRYTHTQKRNSVPGLPVMNKYKVKAQTEDSTTDDREEIKSTQCQDDSNIVVEQVSRRCLPAEKGTESEGTTADLSVGWSFWDEIDQENRASSASIHKTTRKKEERLQFQEPIQSTEVAEEPLYEVNQDDEETEDETNVDVSVEIKLPVIKPSSTSEISGNSDEFSDCEEGDEENESEDEAEDKLEDEIQNELAIADVEVDNPANPKVEQSVPINDETSDESSKSSGTTIEPSPPVDKPLTIQINADQSDFPEDKQPGEETQSSARKDPPTKSKERAIEIREILDKIKLSSSESDKNLSPVVDRNTGGDEHQDQACTCHIGDRMARAESLLWRIERFLHESLSLGSEDDSGVMTDLSRQISDVDTDADNDMNDTEFLLTAAAAVKDRRSLHHHHTQTSNQGKSEEAPVGTKEPTSPVVLRRRPKSEIIFESSSTLFQEFEKTSAAAKTTAAAVAGVKMRTTPAERKALRYQRAKTHSRLFQLLQDECGKDEDDEEGDDEEEEFDFKSMNSKRATPTVFDSMVKDQGSSSVGSSVETRPTMVPINVDTGTKPEPNPRSRLMPLPLKSVLVSSLSCDSSSPSGSSGVLSPTSPVTRDKLLADIINEFHLRHQESSTNLLKSRRRFTRFPSKIFNLLQQEFGEEFYQTFDCSGEELIPDTSSLAKSEDALLPDLGPNPTTGGISHECTIHKSESLKALEEQLQSTSTANDSKQSTPDYLEVPIRRKNKISGQRDFRAPKNKKTT